MRLVLFFTLLIPLPAFADADSSFEDLLERHWEWVLQDNPTFASRLGDLRYNREWKALGVAAELARQERRAGFLNELYAIPRQQLSETNQLNYELFRRELTDEVERHAFRGYLLPFSQRGGVQNLDNLANTLRLETAGDYEDWLARMAKVDDVVDATIELAERGRAAGYVSPAILMRRIPAQIDKQLVEDAEDSPFFTAFAVLAAGIDNGAALVEQAREIIIDEIVPAYRRLKAYVETTYLPSARETVGLSELADGTEWYGFLAMHFTTTRMSPDEIHRLGLAEVKRIREEMHGIIEELGFDGDFKSFLEFLRNDPQFYYDDPDDLYEAYLATSKRIDPELVRLFGKLPRMPYGVKPIPDAIAPDTTTAYYSGPSADGSRAGIYWVNLYKPEVRPKYEIEVLSVHEAVPGHHLQIALQQELSDLPAFRRYSGFTAFTEGWGLYSESLGYELGLYQDPYSRFGQLTYEMWRAVRLVVDTGIHVKGWTRQQAIDFFADNAAKTEHDIVNEIDRYIGNPGQALAYKVGQLRMLSLRRDAEIRLGDRFDVRMFHDELLGAGALPLDVLQQRMDRWIETQLN